MFEGMIGSRLINITDECMIFEKDGADFVAYFDTCDGDCCGYADIKNTLLFDNSSEINPIITKIEKDDTGSSYHDACKITLFGMDKAIATIEAEAGSGSGYCYGACVTVECKGLDLHEDICSW